MITKFLLRALLALSLIAPAAAGAAEGMPVELNPRVEISGETVRLGDIFSGLGARGDVRLGNAPEPGRSVALSADWLDRAARHYDIDWRPGPGSRSKVVRLSHKITGAEIAAAIRGRLEGSGADRLTVELDHRSVVLDLPVDGPRAVDVLALDRDPGSGRFAARIAAGEGRYRETLRVTGRAVELVEVPVTARAIERGAVITERDLVWREVAANDLRRSELTDVAAIVGQAARRRLRADDTIARTDVEAPVLVERNSLVVLRLETPRMRLSVRGRALADGAAGEIVRVRNAASKRTVAGLVQPDGSVVVPADRN
jgi:flagella basal body P-ring formation protein FlgA